MSQPGIICKTATLDCESLRINVGSGAPGVVTGNMLFTGAVGISGAFTPGAITAPSVTATTGTITTLTSTTATIATINNTTLNSTTTNATNLYVNDLGIFQFPGEIDNPTIAPYGLNGNASTQGTLEFATRIIDCSGALVEVGGGKFAVRKIGHFVDFDFRPLGNVASGANAVAATYMEFLSAIPVGYRPQFNRNIPCQIYDNGLDTLGMMQIEPTGTVYFYTGMTLGNFTLATSCALYSVGGSYAIF